MYTDRHRREIFHFCFLERLLRVSDARLYILKGGVNLRFFFNSPRYSEDMDLDVIGGAVATLKKNGYKILADKAFRRSLQTYGISDILINDPDKAKHFNTTQRFRLRLVTRAGVELPSKVEFSRREESEENRSNIELNSINPDIASRYKRLAFACQHYSGQTALVQKVQALAGRPVTQARDVFDIFILLQGGYNDEKIKEVLASDSIISAQDALLNIEYSHYCGQVLEFLNNEDSAYWGSENTWQQMHDTVFQFLEALG